MIRSSLFKNIITVALTFSQFFLFIYWKLIDLHTGGRTTAFHRFLAFYTLNK